MRRGRAKEAVAEHNTEGEEEEKAPSYPSITAADGQLYYIIGPMTLEQPNVVPVGTPPSPQPSSRRGARRSVTPINKKKLSPHNQQQQQLQQQHGDRKGKGSQGKQQQQLSGPNSSRISPLPAPAPPVAFVRTYELLLKDAMQVEGETMQLSVSAVEDWRDMLRLEILNWTVHLRHTSLEYVQGHCVVQKSAIDKETNEVLRHHRRRPATLQAESYEGRLREIENTRTSEDKHCTRLQDRVAKLVDAWSALEDDASAETHEAQLFKQLQDLEKMAAEADSVNALVAQERNFTSLVAAAIEEESRRQHDIIHQVEKQQEALEEECRSYLISHGVNVPANLSELQGCSDWDDDSANKQAVDALLRLNSAARALKEKFTAERESQMRGVDAARSTYTAAFDQNMGELQMLARLQETFARLKVQVHSLTTLSEASEAKIEGFVTELEERLSEAPPMHDFSSTLQEITSRDYHAAAGAAMSGGEAHSSAPQSAVSGTGAAGAGAGDTVVAQMTEDRMRLTEVKLNEQLAGVKLDIQRQIRASDTAKVFRLIDQLREILYTRGRHLNCLQYGVELFNIPQENYIEPRLGAASEPTAEEAGATSLSPQGRSARKVRPPSPPSSALASLYAVTELPDMMPAEAQVSEWLNAVKAQVSSIVEQRFAAHPLPLTRRLPGMAEGSQEDALEMCNNVCEQQRKRVAHHVEHAARRYREQVWRVFNAMQKMPVYLINTTYTMSATALERRVATVFDVFSGFYSESDALRSMYDRLVKVTLASNYNRGRLEALCSAEGVRQKVTQAAIERLWGCVMREMEEEAAMHAARSLNVNNNFFALLRGLVTPESLKPADDDGAGGHHRGLRRLLRLKAREEHAKEIQQQQQQLSPKRERRLQETMPRHKHGGATAQTEKSATSKKDAAAAAAELAGGPLPLPARREVEYGRVPLRAFRPLENFNAAHPDAAVAASATDATPAFARVSVVSRSITGASSRRPKVDIINVPQVEERTPTVAIVAPATLVHQEIATLTQQSVEFFNKHSADAAGNADSAFQEWTTREAVWQTTWGAAISRLRA
ncbi:hypothetical protein DQ04_08831030 [Trypanosoma grayi]|uniref:hypothetical protein n=1 Tax=Trypanosoma grayi TaxID=71804 RepID=UPI0004F46FFE|nr:hypothetical protein DQ04_08831030 [Trypanosoma grayi]KEG07788.1 hypothetical protein DQ04_08831030 [Trypanosoma grayi]